MAKKSMLLAFFVLFISVVPVYAQDATDSAQNDTAPNNTRDALIQRREEARGEVTEERTQLRQEVAAQRQAFQQRLSNIADTQRQAIVERIDTKLQLANENITTRLSDVLNSLTRILDRIELQKDGLEAGGADVSDLESSILGAREAIRAAQVLVDEQSENAYIINITTDAGLRQAAQETIQSFRTDINTVKEAVIGVKGNVQEAARIAASLSTN